METKINRMKKDVSKKKEVHQSKKTELDIAYRDLKKDHGVKTVSLAKKMGDALEKEISKLKKDGSKVITEAEKLLEEYDE